MRRAIGMIIIATAFLGACATGPEPVPPPDEARDTARTLRAQILEFDLAQYAEDEFEVGETQFTTAEVAFETEDYETAEQAYNLAIDRYTIVIRDGFQTIAGTRREEATEAKALADEVKASVAMAENYAEALEIYDRAVDAADAGNHQEAAELFENAALLFIRVYDQAAEKQRQALDALGRVDQRIDELDVQRDALERSVLEEFEEEDSDEEEAN